MVYKMKNENRVAQWGHLYDKMTQYDVIYIARHINPDPDALGSQFGLAAIIQSIFPKKTIVCQGVYVDRLNYLYDSSFIQPQIQVDKYLQIIVDTANIERIDAVIDWTKEIIKIDHHPNTCAYGTLSIVDDTVPATAALLLDFYLYLEQLHQVKLSEVVLAKLYLGIVGDTGNFAYGKGLNQRFFSQVGVIFEQVNTQYWLQKLFQKTAEEMAFKAYFMNKIQLDEQFAFVSLHADELAQQHVSLDFASGLVNVIGELVGVTIWATFCEDTEQQLIRCSLRSRTHNVASIAQLFGGGGHVLAAGVRVATWEEVEQLKQAIKELLITHETTI